MKLILTLFTCALVSLAIATGQAFAIDPEIRFYKANKRLQQDRIVDFGQGDKPGCHDFLKSTRVHRIANYGFEFCVLYSRRNCTEGSEINARWKEDAETRTELAQGARWFPVREDVRGANVGSWKCVLSKDEPGDEQ